MKVSVKSFSVFLVLFSGLANAGSIAMEEETLHLLEYISHSGCVFTRNGSEYSSKEARSHILRKYNYVKSKISTTEQVIKYAATKSSISGKAYTITCPGEELVPSAEWLTAELLNFRSK